MGPVSAVEGVGIGPHPHIGLHTVTWLLSGEMLHRDSLGSEQVIRPGQLNLMTAGHGVVHAEEDTGANRAEMHGVQLWVAQPESTRQGEAAFEHHADLPQVELAGTDATVLVGEFAGAASTARRDTELVGVDAIVRAAGTWPLRRDFEHAVVVLSGAAAIAGVALRPGQLGYLGADRDELEVEPRAPDTRLLLLGGVPFPEPILMWWNFVARTRAEMDAAHDEWPGDGARFGRVNSSLGLIRAPSPPWRAT
jgi:redox-sensitive bicupin YhaK (pirin superfamily)